MALVELCLPLATPAWPENKQTAPLLSFKWPLFFKFHSGSPRRRWEKARRRKNVVPTFPPPRRHNQQNMAVLCRHVVTSMARGGNIWGEWVFFFFFLSLFAPRVSHIGRSGRGHRRVSASSAGLSAPTHQPRRSNATFRTPALFIDFDLRDSDVGVPPRRLLPVQAAALAAYADAALEQKT